MIWDEGTWEPLADPDDGIAKGDLKFRLHGKRLKGDWVLVRMRNKPGEKRENWLLIKKSDRYADPDKDVTETYETSVKSGRDMAVIANDPLPAKAKTKSAPTKLPDFAKPQLATLVEESPEGEGWLHEIKYDGYRLIAAVSGDHVRFYIRSGQNWTKRFAQLVPAFQALKLNRTLIDGEAVVFDSKDHSRFSMLQSALKDGDEQMTFMAFDLLALGGQSLRSKPLKERKAELAKLLKGAKSAVRYSAHVEGNGERMQAKACAMGLEGIVSKRADASYRSGRSRIWVKSKCAGRDEFVIGGWRPSKVKGRPFASLLLGEFHSGALLYRGRVGTGFDEAEMDALAKRLKARKRQTSPFRDVPPSVARRKMGCASTRRRDWLHRAHARWLFASSKLSRSAGRQGRQIRGERRNGER